MPQERIDDAYEKGCTAARIVGFANAVNPWKHDRDPLLADAWNQGRAAAERAAMRERADRQIAAQAHLRSRMLAMSQTLRMA